MKKYFRHIFSIILVLLFVPMISQSNFGKYKPRYTKIITKENATIARLMSDLIFDYPRVYYNTLFNYVEIEISSYRNGKTAKAVSYSDSLTKEQKSLINEIDLGCELTIAIQFQYKDSANDNLGTGGKIKHMNYVVAVLPEHEAEFPGGNEAVTKYFVENFMKPFCDTSNCDMFPRISVKLTVNESGTIETTKLLQSSGNTRLDELFINLINKMPQWKPAENKNGEKVKEEFTINVPFRRGGC